MVKCSQWLTVMERETRELSFFCTFFEVLKSYSSADILYNKCTGVCCIFMSICVCLSIYNTSTVYARLRLYIVRSYYNTYYTLYIVENYILYDNIYYIQ